MSRHEYEMSKKIAAEDYPFYAVVMAAMRQADSSNLLALKREFPLVYTELQQRYASPGGALPGDPT